MTVRSGAGRAAAECAAAGLAAALVLHLWMLLAGHTAPTADPGAGPVASTGGHIAACPGAMSACRALVPDDPERPLPPTLLAAAVTALLLLRRPHHPVEPATTPRDERGPPRSPGPAAVVLLE